MNIRGLYPRSDKTKVAYLSQLTADDNVPFVALQETHLTPDVLGAEVHLEGYTLYRSDRAGGRSHGGVALYVRDDLTTRQLSKYSNNFVESQVLEIVELELVLVNIYRPPNSPKQLFLETLEICQEALDGKARNKSVLMLGDYNFPFIKWPEGSIYTREQEQMSSEKEQGRLLVEWTNDNFLEQIIVTPTRKENILDLVFTSSENIVAGYEMIINNVFSDHNTIKLKLNIEKEVEKRSITNPYPNKIYEYDVMKGTDEDWVRYDKMMEKEADKFDEETENIDTEEKLKRFYRILEQTTTFLFEVKEVFKNKDDKTQTTRKNKIPKTARRLMIKKRKLSDKMQTCKSKTKMVEMMHSLAKIEVELKESLDKHRRKKETEAISKIKRNPKFFFSYANKHSKTRNKVGPLLNKEEESIKDPSMMAEILREQYESAFSKVQDKDDDEEEYAAEEEEEEEVNLQEDAEFSDIAIHYTDVAEAIDKLSMWSGPGPDGVSGILLKKAKLPIARMLSNILQSSLDTCTIPDVLKLAFICPTLKPSGSRERAASWRPISLTSHVVKTWERVIRKALVNFLEVNDKMDPNQHGSRQNRA